MRFWKIAVFVKGDGRLSASAYLLEQEELVEGLERFEADTFQVTVGEIVERTGLDFGYLAPFEAKLEGGEGLERTGGLESEGGFVRRRLSRVSQVTA